MSQLSVEIKVGDKIITKYGKAGRVVALPNEVEYEDGTREVISDESNYYLIGNIVIGNKCSEDELNSALYDIDGQIDALKLKKKQLRKQLWRLSEEMVPDWRDRRNNRMYNKFKKEQEDDSKNENGND